MEEADRERLCSFHTFATPHGGMEMTTEQLSRMRTCFAVAAVWCGWNETERAEISAEIRSALDAGDEEMLSFWRDWLEDMSDLQRIAALCRAAEARIKADSVARRAS
jgi:hypothetical protein